MPATNEPHSAQTGKAKTSDAFGVLADKAKDNLYRCRHGFIYTSPWVVTKATTRFSASILLTAGRAGFEITIDGRTTRHTAAALRPVLERGLCARDARLVSVQVNPFHPLFRRFRAIPPPGLLSLERDIFSDFDEALEHAYRGELSPSDASLLLERITERTSRYLPRIKRADPRIERAKEMLKRNINFPLTELAAAVGLSYDRMSHLFADSVGLPLRSYLLWIKIYNASLLRGSGLTLTEIADAAGFASPAHLCNAWQQAFGTAPSQFFNEPDFVRIHGPQRRADGTRAGPWGRQAAPTSRSPRRKEVVSCRHCGGICHKCGSPLCAPSSEAPAPEPEHRTGRRDA